MRVDFDVVVTGKDYCEHAEAAVWDGHHGVRKWMREEMKASETHIKVSAYTNKGYYLWMKRGEPMIFFRRPKV